MIPVSYNVLMNHIHLHQVFKVPATEIYKVRQKSIPLIFLQYFSNNWNV